MRFSLSVFAFSLGAASSMVLLAVDPGVAVAGVAAGAAVALASAEARGRMEGTDSPTPHV